jgi:glycosyltransferase involved in cell wall biosynthesis
VNVLIHAVGVVMGGAKRHLGGFLPALDAIAGDHEFTVLVRNNFAHPETGPNVRVETVQPKWSNRAWGRIWYDNFCLPRRLARQPWDAVVSMTNHGPILSPVPHIIFQRNPNYFNPGAISRGLRGNTAYAARRALAVLAMRRASAIVTPSDAMAAMIRARCPTLRRHRFKTLYHGFSFSDYSEPLDESLRLQIEALEGTRLLFPCHLSPQKGFEVLIEAIQQLKCRRSDFTLIATCDPADWPAGYRNLKGRIARADLTRQIQLVGQIPQSQMGQLYRSCDAVVFPSLSESFGFPLLEAMAFERPVVAAGTETNLEICGTAALYYEPRDGSDAASSIEKILAPVTRERLRLSARERMRSYDWSWNRYAREFVELLADASRGSSMARSL